MKKNRLTLAIAATTLFASSASLADNAMMGKQGLSVNPGVGYYSFDSDLKLEDKSFPSLGVEYRFNNNFAVEGTYTQTETSNELATNQDFDWTHYHLDALYYFRPGNKLQPYVAAGAGEGTLERSQTNLSDEETLLNIGGGIKYFFNQSLSLRGDLRAINSQDNETTSGAATVSLAWLLGGGTSRSSQGDFDLSQADADQDSVLDVNDTCPGTPPSVTVDEKGCAVDLDQDGIADYRDQCANTPAGIQVDGVGCPQDLDSDGIADYQDKCPDTKKGHVINEEGCSIKVTEAVSMNMNVNFPTNSTLLPEKFMDDVEELASFMKRYKDTIAIIEGHSDSIGDSEYNKMLSKKRAEAIRKLLVSKFKISEERLKAVGFGAAKPVASNNTQEGRQQNRRVVASIQTTVEKTQE